MLQTHKRLLAILIVIVSILAIDLHSIAQVQAERKVECGDALENEFTKDNESQFFVITMNPKDSFSVSIETVGDFLSVGVALYGPTGVQLINTSNPQPAVSFESGVLSARGSYKIQVANGRIWGEDSLTDVGGVGIYTLSISCIKSDGTVIESGAPSTKIEKTTDTAIPHVDTATSVQQQEKRTITSLLEIGKAYEILTQTFTQTFTITDILSDGWIQVENEGKVSWLNLSHVVLITPVEN